MLFITRTDIWSPMKNEVENKNNVQSRGACDIIMEFQPLGGSTFCESNRYLLEKSLIQE